MLTSRSTPLGARLLGRSAPNFPVTPHQSTCMDESAPVRHRRLMKHSIGQPVDRFVWDGSTLTLARHNRCGRCSRPSPPIRRPRRARQPRRRSDQFVRTASCTSSSATWGGAADATSQRLPKETATTVTELTRPAWDEWRLIQVMGPSRGSIIHDIETTRLAVTSTGAYPPTNMRTRLGGAGADGDAAGRTLTATLSSAGISRGPVGNCFGRPLDSSAYYGDLSLVPPAVSREALWRFNLTG